MLMKAISLDSQAVQRHRATILECVKVSCDHILFYFLLISLPSKSPVFYGFICSNRMHSMDSTCTLLPKY